MNIIQRTYRRFTNWFIQFLLGDKSQPEVSRPSLPTEARRKNADIRVNPVKRIQLPKFTGPGPHDRERMDAAAKKRARRNAKRAALFHGVK